MFRSGHSEHIDRRERHVSSLTPREVFLRLVHGVADRRFDTLPRLYAEETDVRHPMWPGGTPPLTSREALRHHFTAGAASSAVVRFHPDNIVVHETQDPEVVVAEFEYRGTVIATNQPYTVPCVFVMRVRDGQIIESRDYIDHLASARARGQLDQVLAAIDPTDAS
jgi:ketosteroid isomerase-like protein